MLRKFQKNLFTFVLLVLIGGLIIPTIEISASALDGILIANNYDGYSTVTTTNLVNSILENAGYDGTVYTNYGSDDIYELLGDNEEFFYYKGHGTTQGGTLFTYDAGTQLVSYFKGAGGSNSDSTRKYYISNLPSNALSNMKIAVYVGCYTGMEPSSNKLLQETVDLGANVAVGFSSSLYQSYSKEWSLGFISALKDGQTVSGAIVHADYRVMMVKGSDGGTKSRKYVGNGSTTLN